MKDIGKDIGIHRIGVRQTLKPRREPYWGPRLAANQHLGYRKINATSGSWIARLKKDGNRTYESLGLDTDDFGFDQAHAAALECFRKLDKGMTGTDLTVQGACDEYVKNLRIQKKKESAAHDAEKRFEREVNDSALGRVRLADLQKHHIQKWIDALDMTPASLVRTFTAVRAALNLAVRRGVRVEASQWTALELPDVPDNRRELFLDLKQRRALLKAAKGGLRDLIQGAMLTGRRPGELTSALCSQFDARTGLMTFVGKTGRDPRVPLAAPALKLFKRLTKGKPPTAHIFTRDDGLKWNHSDWDELVKDAAKEAGLPDDTVLYSLRHSWITEAISGGMTTLDVARLTGTSLQMIEKHYGKLVPDAARARLSKVKFV